MRTIFLTGATGYIGRHLIPVLIDRGYAVRALVRDHSVGNLAAGAVPVRGNALDAMSFARALEPADTLIHLVGVAHPGPGKGAEFRSIDLVSIQQTVLAARGSSIRHIIYLSVAQPAPVMKEYVEVRAEGERLLRESGIPSTFIRPWYVLGPGHRWPYLILPLYWIWGAFPKHRETARRLYPVKLKQVVRAIAEAVDQPPDGVRIIDAAAMASRGTTGVRNRASASDPAEMPM